MTYRRYFSLTLAAALILAHSPAAQARRGHAPASAGEPMDPAFEVSVNPDVYPVQAFEKHGFKTEALAPTEPSSYDAPTPEMRDQAFRKVPGLEALVARMDMLDKDLLFIRAKNYPAEKLREAYPKADPQLLGALAEALRTH